MGLLWTVLILVLMEDTLRAEIDYAYERIKES